MKLTNFYLKKLYFDCIDEEGNCFIVYWAVLKFSLLKINYSGVLFSNARNECIERSSLRKMPEPAVNRKIHFNQPSLQITGEWSNTDTPIVKLLYKDQYGKELFWNCHHPKAYAKIEFNHQIFQGFGYAETLSLPIKPWKLPIDELRWGRFLSKEITIIWINWKGKYPVNELIYNGISFKDAVFEKNKITFDRGRANLSFQEISIVRKGKLSGLLVKMPWLKMIFNNKILNTQENKYKSPSIFTRDSKELARGWSLYEVVTWVK